MRVADLLTFQEAAELAGASVDSIKHAVYRAKTLTVAHHIDRKPLLFRRDVLRWNKTTRKPGPKPGNKRRPRKLTSG